MKANRQVFALRISVVAVQGALMALALTRVAVADDEPTVQQLVKPTSSVEVGATGVSKDSFKAGEYNGMPGKGVYGVGNIDLRGGGAYDSNDATRWRIRGTDLGLQTRDIEAEWGEQGKFRVNFGFDELLRNKSDSYMTPYLGAGGTTLTLPANWAAPAFQTGASMTGGNHYPAPANSMLGLAATGPGSPLVTNTRYLCRSDAVAAVVTAGNATPATTCTPSGATSSFLGAYTTPYPLTTLGTLTAANLAMLAQNQVDLNDFHAVNLSTVRDKYSLGAGLSFTRHLDATFSVKREDKTGLKGLGLVNSGVGENAVVMPELINTTTDQFNGAVNYKGERSFVTVAYYGSIFTNHAKSMTVDNPWGSSVYNGATTFGIGNTGATITEEPDSVYQQVRVTGGYDFSKTMRLVADVAYSRNTQNDTFILDPGMFSTPSNPAGAGAFFAAPNNGSYAGENSANAVVATQNIDLKLTARPLPRLNLSGAYKYDNRDNQTPVSTFVWYDAGAKNAGTAALATNASLNGAAIPGVPSTLPLYGGVNILNNRPYSKRINQFDFDGDYAVMRGHTLRAGFQWQETDRSCKGTWIDCSFADHAYETTERAEYKFHALETLTARIGADWSQRHVNYNDNAWMALVPTLAATNVPGLLAATTGGGRTPYTGSIYDFLVANGLNGNGLPIAANAVNPFAANPTLLAIYQQLYGTGNGSLAQKYYGNANATANWAGLDVYNMANRDRMRVRGAVDWQALESLSLQVGGDYRHENYDQTVYGLKNTNAWAVNFDGDWAPGETLSVGGFYTHEDQSQTAVNSPNSNGSVSAVTAAGYGAAYTAGPPIIPAGTILNNQVAGLCGADSAAGLAALANPAGAPAAPTQYQIYNNNLKIDPCNRWQADMHDKTDTVGLSVTKRRFVVSKLTVRGDVSYSHSITSNTMTGGTYAASSVAGFINGVPAVYYVQAQSLPDVTTNMLQLRLSAGYALSKASALRLSYVFSKLHTDDWVYSTNQAANTSGTVMPTFETAPNYAVQSLGVSYVYSFQ